MAACSSWSFERETVLMTGSVLICVKRRQKLTHLFRHRCKTSCKTQQGSIGQDKVSVTPMRLDAVWVAQCYQIPVDFFYTVCIVLSAYIS